MSWPCQEQSIVGIAGRKARVSALRCRRWSCEYCAPRLRRKMVARALAGFGSGERVRMLTLTSPAHEDPARSYEELRTRWKRLRELIRRRFPAIRFDYFAVTERQKRGHAHLHVLFRGGFLPQRWVSAAATRAGFGPIVDLRALGKAAGRYVSKYLGKEMGKTPEMLGIGPLPKWHRRATWSQGWAPEFTARGKALRAALVAYAWYLANARPLLIADRLQRSGYEIDAIDYGDAAPRTQAWELHRQEPVQMVRAGTLPCRCLACRQRGPQRGHAPLWSAIPIPPPVRYQLWPEL